MKTNFNDKISAGINSIRNTEWPFPGKCQRKVNLRSDTMNYGLTLCKKCIVIEEKPISNILVGRINFLRNSPKQNTCLRWPNTVCARFTDSVSDAIKRALGLW